MIDRYVIAALLCTVCALPSWAETTARRGGGDNGAVLLQLQQAQTQAQAATAERDALKAENAKLQAELDAIKKEAARLRTDKAAMQQRIDTSDNTVTRFKEANSQAVDRLRETQERLDKVVEKYKELVTNLKEIETEKVRLQDRDTTQSAQLDVCAKHNLALYQVNIELLEKYRNKSVWDALRQREPVTGLGRVEIENIGEQYRARIDKERLEDTVNTKGSSSSN